MTATMNGTPDFGSMHMMRRVDETTSHVRYRCSVLSCGRELTIDVKTGKMTIINVGNQTPHNR